MIELLIFAIVAGLVVAIYLRGRRDQTAAALRISAEVEQALGPIGHRPARIGAHFPQVGHVGQVVDVYHHVQVRHHVQVTHVQGSPVVFVDESAAVFARPLPPDPVAQGVVEQGGRHVLRPQAPATRPQVNGRRALPRGTR